MSLSGTYKGCKRIDPEEGQFLSPEEIQLWLWKPPSLIDAETSDKSPAKQKPPVNQKSTKNRKSLANRKSSGSRKPSGNQKPSSWSPNEKKKPNIFKACSSGISEEKGTRKENLQTFEICFDIRDVPVCPRFKRIQEKNSKAVKVEETNEYF